MGTMLYSRSLEPVHLVLLKIYAHEEQLPIFPSLFNLNTEIQPLKWKISERTCVCARKLLQALNGFPRANVRIGKVTVLLSVQLYLLL